MSSQPSWRPNLSESQLFNEKTFLQGVILSAVAYGANLALFILIISPLSTRLKVDIKHNGRASRLTTCLLTYVCVMFILSTLSLASQAEMTQLGFIENRDFPGGPLAYEKLMVSSPISRISDSCFRLMNWFSDSLLLWRCSVVYRSTSISVWLVMAIPGLILLGSFITGTILLIRVPRASSSSYMFQLTYAIMSLTLNIVLTLMIIFRLYHHRRRFTKLLGRRQAALYTSIISMLIESAAILIIMLLWYLIPFAMGNHLSDIPDFSMVQVQAAASYMIIYRVAKGTAWTTQTGDYEFTIPNLSDHVGGIQTQTTSVEHSADRPITSLSRNQFPMDGPHHVAYRGE